MKGISGELAAPGNGPEGFSDRVTRLMKKVVPHVHDVEDKIFPASRELLSEESIWTCK